MIEYIDYNSEEDFVGWSVSEAGVLTELDEEDLPFEEKGTASEMTDADSKKDDVKAKADALIANAGEFKSGSDIEITFDKKGNLRPTRANVCYILAADDNLKNFAGFDEVKQAGVVSGAMPWDFGKKRAAGDRITKIDKIYLKDYLERQYGMIVDRVADEALWEHLHEHKFNPIQDYFNSLKWDGVKRLDETLIKYYGAEDYEDGYSRFIFRKTLISGVARTFEPGCDVQTVLCLQGGQGIGKSHLCKLLGGQWFSDTLDDIGSKEAYMQLQGVLVMEIGEGALLKRSDTAKLKGFISASVDKYRKVYAEDLGEYARRNIFIVTSNEPEFLKDDTGNRRFWPIALHAEKRQETPIGNVNEDYINQLWAEAYEAYKHGETWMLDDEQKEIAKHHVQEFEEEDVEAGELGAILNRPIPESWYQFSKVDHRDYFNKPEYMIPAGMDDNLVKRKKVCIAEILNLMYGTSEKPKYIRNDISKRLIKLGWEKRHVVSFGPYGNQQAYFKK